MIIDPVESIFNEFITSMYVEKQCFFWGLNWMGNFFIKRIMQIQRYIYDL